MGGGLRIAHINLRSVNKKMELIKATFENSNVSVISMSETWLNNMIVLELSIIQ